MSRFKPNQEMLHNYIQNKLSPAETEQLELWLADHPDVIQELEMDLMFKQGAAEDRVNDEIQVLAVEHSNSSNLFRYLGLAAVLFITFLTGLVTSNIFKFNRSNSIINPNIIMLSTYRGGEELIEVSNVNDLIVQIPTGYLSEDLFSVEFNLDSELKYELSRLKPESDLITVLIPKNTLEKSV
jgi:hypothetical protein